MRPSPSISISASGEFMGGHRDVKARSHLQEAGIALQSQTIVRMLRIPSERHSASRRSSMPLLRSTARTDDARDAMGTA